MEDGERSARLGMTVVARAGGNHKENHFVPSDELTITLTKGWRRRYKCGHRAPRRYKLMIYGCETKELKYREYCPECSLERVKKYVIRCCLCRHAIFPGDGVALYSQDTTNLQMDIATMVGDAVIGCMGWNCCPVGLFFAGHWTEEGFAPAFGGLCAGEAAMASGQPVFVSKM